jgi:hypothetical protein
MPMFIRIKDYIFAVDQIESVKLKNCLIVVSLKNGQTHEVFFESVTKTQNEFSQIDGQLNYISRTVLGQILNLGEKKK